MQLNILRLLLAMVPMAVFGPLASAEPRVSFVPEMDALPLEEYGALRDDYQVSAEESAGWSQIFPFVSRDLVSDQKVKDLSRWARGEMKTYHFKPGAVPELVAYGFNQNVVVYAATLDRLPSAHPSVVRLLKIYVVGLNENHQFLPNHLIMTIRGERLE